jgi:hypothetical protein
MKPLTGIIEFWFTRLFGSTYPWSADPSDFLDDVRAIP